MADLRCPMCSKPNPEGAEECAFCGARLKPVLAGSPPPPADQGLPPMPDWLSRLRAPEDEPPAPEQPSAAEGEGDWLARLRSTDPQWSSSEWGQEAAAPSAASASSAPEEPARPSARAEEGPDWLTRLREALIRGNRTAGRRSPFLAGRSRTTRADCGPGSSRARSRAAMSRTGSLASAPSAKRREATSRLKRTPRTCCFPTSSISRRPAGTAG